MSWPVKQYSKAACTPQDLLTHVKAKNLTVTSDADALKCLQSIGYYRLLIYMRHFQDVNKNFQPGTSFEDILNIYNFDRKLRLHCLNAIERIEVALRASIINRLTVLHGPHFYTESRHFSSIEGFQAFLSRAQQAQYLAISHYYRNYNSPSLPPVWAITEAVTFGTLSQFFSNLHIDNQKPIALDFGYDRQILLSWFRSLTTIRNMCAHHNRLWNYSIIVNKPKSAKKLQRVNPVNDTSFCARAVVMNALLRQIDPRNTWAAELKRLIGEHGINSAAMGFPAGWEAETFWN